MQQQQQQQQQPMQLLPRLTTLHASSHTLQLLLAMPAIALPSLTDLRCAAELQGPNAHFAELLRRLPQLDSLTLLPSASPWVSLSPARLCHPSELVGLTRLVAHYTTVSCAAPRRWWWTISMFGIRPQTTSGLARLEIQVDGREVDFVALLSGLPSLSSLKLAFPPAYTLGMSGDSTVEDALLSLGALVELELVGHSATVLRVLGAAGRAVGPRIQRASLTTSCREGESYGTDSWLKACLRSFPALRELRVQPPGWFRVPAALAPRILILKSRGTDRP